MGLRIGDDVRHAKFGEGVILAIEGEGDKAEAVVRFRGVGEKRLLLAWSPLQRLCRRTRFPRPARAAAQRPSSAPGPGEAHAAPSSPFEHSL